MPSSNPTYQRVVGALPQNSSSSSVVSEEEPRFLGQSERLLGGSGTAMDNISSSQEELGGPVVGHMPSNNSSEELIVRDSPLPDDDGVESGKSHMAPPVPIRSSGITAQEFFTVFVLCFVNLINYMDRLTIAGVLPDIQNTFDRDNSDGGLLQTVFVISYMICAPAFGYLGDRYSRRWIMILGVALWSGTTLLGSFMNSWGWFMTFRALVGIGEASYSTIAPTIISDLFTHNQRSKMLAFFYFAIPVGSGLGYMIGSETAKAFGDWRYALRVTPLLGLIAVILIYFCKEPERGENEGSGHMQATSYKEDLKDLCKNRSFMYSTLGFTCVAFVTGGLSWWGPTFMHLGVRLQPGNENIELSRVSLIFGGITLISGIIGVPLGSILSQRLKKRFPRCDPLICGIGLFLSFPLILGAMLMISANSAIAFTLMFLGVLSLNCNWAIVGDILLYVVVPTRRSTAEAFQILISHMFGDAGSPYLVGLLSQAFRSENYGRQSAAHPPKLDYIHPQVPGLNILAQVAENSTSLAEASTIGSFLSMNATTSSPLVPHVSFTQLQDEFTSLQYALFIMCFVEVLGAALFFVTSFYVVHDKQKVDRAIHDSQQRPEMNEESTESSSLSM